MRHQLSFFILIGSFDYSLAQLSERSYSSEFSGGFEAYYLEYLPDNYLSSKESFPVIFYLHGFKEKSSQKGRNELYKLKKATSTPPYIVERGDQLPFIILSLQLPSGIGNWPFQFIDEFVEFIRASELKIDYRSMYLTGISLGGGGVWNHALKSVEYASKWAAIAPIAATKPSFAKACNIVIAGVSVWGHHGKDDKVTAPRWTKTMIDTIHKCSPNPNIEVKLSLYDSVGHNSWQQAYDITKRSESLNLYEWFLTQRRLD